jgi:hypothetical protein
MVSLLRMQAGLDQNRETGFYPVCLLTMARSAASMGYAGKSEGRQLPSGGQLIRQAE